MNDWRGVQVVDERWVQLPVAAATAVSFYLFFAGQLAALRALAKVVLVEGGLTILDHVFDGVRVAIVELALLS